MIDSPTGIIPEELMYKERRGDVVMFIQRLLMPGHLKRDLLQSWAMTVRTRITQEEFKAVEQSGTHTATGN